MNATRILEIFGYSLSFLSIALSIFILCHFRFEKLYKHVSTYLRGSFQNTEDPGEKNTFSSLSCYDYTGKLSLIEWIKLSLLAIDH